MKPKNQAPTFSINALAELTGADRRTLKKRLRGVAADSVDRAGVAKFSLATLTAALRAPEPVRASSPLDVDPAEPLAQQLRSRLLRAIGHAALVMDEARGFAAEVREIVILMEDADGKGRFAELAIPMDARGLPEVFKAIELLEEIRSRAQKAFAHLETADIVFKFVPDEFLKEPRDE